MQRAVLIVAAILVAVVMLVMPLVVVFTEALSAGPGRVAEALADPDAHAAIWLTVEVAAISVTLNTIFGVAAAWCITKHDFPLRNLLVTLIELPLSVSPVVSGLVWMLVFGAQGWLGPWLRSHGIGIVFALPGIVLATVFVTFPFVVRPLLPLMQAQGREQEEAAALLGAGLWRTLWHVTMPEIRAGLLSGVLLCNARAMGEFGAVAVVSGHIPGVTETMPLRVEALYNDFQAGAAFAMAALLASLALVTLAAKAALEARTGRLAGPG
jgi:sulfate transport system permease protein